MSTLVRMHQWQLLLAPIQTQERRLHGRWWQVMASMMLTMTRLTSRVLYCG
jgi:hypothetical protein